VLEGGLQMKKKYEDKRNWKEYNKKLVKRGEFYINPQFLETWLQEVKTMNQRKEGYPYLYPESLIQFAAVLHIKSFDYRAVEGILHGLAKHFNQFPVISYSQICRRTNQLDPLFATEAENIIAGVDGSGMKVSNRGDWMRHKWQVKKGWVKIVILGDTTGKIVDVRVGNENLDERKAARGMMRRNKKRIKKLLADGLHDCEATFNLCEALDIEPVIKIRKNASSQGIGPRPRAVQIYKEKGHENWCKEKEYGLRWICTEGIFSAVKRIFGECLHATKKRNIYHEAKLKFWAYQKVQNIC